MNAELEKRVAYLQSSAGEGPRDASQKRSSRDSTEMQSQLNDTLSALKTAEEKIRVMQAGTNGQEPVWNSPGKGNGDSMWVVLPNNCFHLDAYLGRPSSLKNAQSSVAPKLSEGEIEKMTVAQLKEWLMRNNCEEMVWNTLQQSNPRKADWVQMVKERMK